MNVTKVKEIYDKYYCVFCNEEATEVQDEYYLCSCLDSKDFHNIRQKQVRLEKDVHELETKCKIERSYRKMMQMELF